MRAVSVDFNRVNFALKRERKKFGVRVVQLSLLKGTEKIPTFNRLKNTVYFLKLGCK